ncbi:hypothetical protein HWV62_30893 [Athelia sp. TMB]|nr:hypothetical protein HWV62_30893 [Athelia sp. TMB]
MMSSHSQDYSTHRVRDDLDAVTGLEMPAHAASQSFNTRASENATVTNIGGNYIYVNGDYNEYKIDEQKGKDIFRWLGAPETSRNFHAAREAHHAHTGSWFVCGKAFLRWKEQPDSPLWVYGSPGCGKTVICSSAVEDVIKDCEAKPSGSFTYAYFFFDSRSAENDLSVHEKFVRSIILQLWHHFGKIPSALLDIYGQGPSHPQPPLAILEHCLQAIIREFQHVYIMIDALDECVDREKLLIWIKGISKWASGKLHLMFSSRQERDIMDQIAAVHGLQHVRFAGGNLNPDILRYIDDTLSEIVKWAPETRTMVKLALLERADGSFRWVALQLKELIQCSSLRNLKLRLCALPKDLEETYQRLLCKSSNPEDLRIFLQWIAFAVRPISLEELADAITIDFQSSDQPCYDPDLRYMDPRDVLTVCSGFVTEFEGLFLSSKNVAKSANKE